MVSQECRTFFEYPVDLGGLEGFNLRGRCSSTSTPDNCLLRSHKCPGGSKSGYRST